MKGIWCSAVGYYRGASPAVALSVVEMHILRTKRFRHGLNRV